MLQIQGALAPGLPLPAHKMPFRAASLAAREYSDTTEFSMPSCGQTFFSNGAGHKKLQPACRTGKLKVLRCDYAQTRSLQSGETAASK
jgi:hypothetical protein